jgi:multiphosphoryl transfer protein
VVGLVIVSHSATLAEGIAELARGMGAEVPIELAGGIDAPEPALGTDAAQVLEAIERADQGEGVLVLMDLGSAVLSAEMALDLLSEERRGRVVLSEAPLVEGAVAAAVTAKLGASLADVAAEARGALGAKATHLGSGEPAAPLAAAAAGNGTRTITLTVRNPLGLHARPAARFVQTAGGFGADITVTNLTTGGGPASGRSLNAIATLGVRQGHEIAVAASGPQADQALAALEALAARDFDEQAAVEPAPPPLDRPQAGPPGALVGLPAAPGIALGPARHFRVPAPEIPTGPAADPGAEWEALQQALARVRTEIRATRDSVAARAGEYSAAIFDAHILFLEDDELLEPARRAIFEHGKNAARAWHDASESVAARYRSLDDEYLQARAEDLAGVARQVVAELVGGEAPAAVAEPGIVLAGDLTPADTAALDRELVRGIATAHGGPTSHSAILARSLGIPAAVGLGEPLLEVPEGAPLALDGDAGAVVVDPAEELVRDFERRRAERKEEALRAWASAQRPAQTRDGRRIEVVANVGSPEDVDAAVANGAEGVGLLRTEFLFLERDSLPAEDEQYAAYTDMAELLQGRPLILRTLDVGADKPLSYLPRRTEANPFLGVRGIRLGLAQPELLETQLRAALRAAAKHPLKVMFPMVTTLAEFRQAVSVLHSAREQLGAPRMEVGIMVEVPAAALAAESFAREVDFFSIGTNDLVQYTMAAERGNEAVAGLADGLHPAVLRLIRGVVAAAETHGRWVGVCGELGADPLAVPVLVGLGVSELSVNPPAIPATKEAVRQLDMGTAGRLAREALRLDSAGDVRALVAGESAKAPLALSERP